MKKKETMKRLDIMLTDSLRKQGEKLAEREHVSLSHIIRQGLRHYINVKENRKVEV